MPTVAFTLDEVKRTVVLTTVHSLHESPHFLATAVAIAATTTTETLQVIVLSPFFNPPAHPDVSASAPAPASDPPAPTETEPETEIKAEPTEIAAAPPAPAPHDDWHVPGVSRTAAFEDVQRLLTFVYVQATKVAQDLDRVLLDIDVCLKGPADAFPHDAVHAAERIFSVAPNGTPFPPLPASATARKSEIIVVEPDDAPSSPAAAAPAPSPAGPAEPALPPHYPVVALGGTFDHLHAGHKILLSMGAWLAQEKLIVGVTDDALLGKKQWKEVLEPLPVRTARTRAFLELFKPGIAHELTPISDVYGPTASEANVQALVVSRETLAGAESIAKKREEMALPPLQPFVIDVISAAEASVDAVDAAALRTAKMSSTYIRQWLVKKQQQAQEQVQDNSDAVEAPASTS